ncbi:hypothetical protein KORDIASMS9_02777 [Kordia sp. SMS9]|uniref:hypothetical protein n=1 Tax=Kordia sp. SMS9 TaxID=2282170 RepID=UPI000E0D45F9|nr:hypothetical protein [Kordia sp. SMS9]AXG70537.1 hypothetical protein KORDIASMS9_02777 [Kordia sp. SMS9]
MTKSSLHTINYLIAALAIISCIISIFNNDIYQDGEWINAQWLGQDIVTLGMAVPILLISIIKTSDTKNRQWRILNSGILLYFVYTYIFYVFAAKLTFLYLFHIPIFSLATFGFVLSCLKLHTYDCGFALPRKSLKYTIIVYLILIVLMLSFIWLGDIFAHLTNPEHRSETPDGEAPLIIYSLDLAIIIPLMCMAAFLLYKQKNWGYILTGIILAKAGTLGFALMAMSLSMYIQKLNPDYFLIILWSFIGIIGTLLTILYLKNLTLTNNTKVRK